MKPIYIVAIVVASIVALVVAGIFVTIEISSNRFDCAATRNRACSAQSLQRALLPETYLNRLLDLIHAAHEAFAESNMAYVAIGGTLLSAMRKNSTLIPWDDDADFGVFASQWDNKEHKARFVDALQKRGLVLLRGDAVMTERIVYAEKSDALDSQPFIDVFVYERDKQNRNRLHYQHALSRLRFAREATTIDEMFPLRIAMLKYGDREYEINVPAKAERMLTRSYGERWRTQFVVASHNDATMVAPCTLSDEQAIQLGLL